MYVYTHLAWKLIHGEKFCKPQHKHTVSNLVWSKFYTFSPVWSSLFDLVWKIGTTKNFIYATLQDPIFNITFLWSNYKFKMLLLDYLLIPQWFSYTAILQQEYCTIYEIPILSSVKLQLLILFINNTLYE